MKCKSTEWAVRAFAALLVVTAAVFFWAGHGMTFFNLDDLKQFSTISWSPTTFITPLNGHLILFSRLLFHLVASTIGPEYWVLRLCGIAGILVMDALLFALVRRRVGPSIALAVTIPVLFLGSAWEALLWPTGDLTVVYAIAAGLGAFLALEEDGLRHDLLAGGLLILSLASFTIGVCFAAGVAVLVLRRFDRWRRSWIFAVPLALWGIWWLWARRYGGTGVVLSNLPDLPLYYWRSLAAVATSLTGAIGVGVPGVSFLSPPPQNLNHSSLLGLVAVAAVVLLLRRRRSVPSGVWPFAVTLLAYWTLTCLDARLGRGANASRYMLLGAIGLLLVVAELARGIRIGRFWLGGLYVATVTMAVLNLLILLQAHEFFLDYSNNARVQFAMIELAGRHAQPQFDPGLSTPAASSPFLLISAGRYLNSVMHYGSAADTLAQVQASSGETRARADAVLVGLLGLGVRPVSAPVRARACTVVTGGPTGPTTFALPAGGATLRVNRGSYLLLGRFEQMPTVVTALIAPGHWEQLVIPVDHVVRRWMATSVQAGTVDVCPNVGSGSA